MFVWALTVPSSTSSRGRRTGKRRPILMRVHIRYFLASSLIFQSCKSNLCVVITFPPPHIQYNFNFILCNFSVRRLKCKKKSKKNIFCPLKIEKTSQKSCSESAQTPFSHGLAQATAHSPKLISHIKKFRDHTSVLLSVDQTY